MIKSKYWPQLSPNTSDATNASHPFPPPPCLSFRTRTFVYSLSHQVSSKRYLSQLSINKQWHSSDSASSPHQYVALGGKNGGSTIHDKLAQVARPMAPFFLATGLTYYLVSMAQDAGSKCTPDCHFFPRKLLTAFISCYVCQ